MHDTNVRQCFMTLTQGHSSKVKFMAEFMTKGVCLLGYGRCAAVHGKSLSQP